MTKEVLKLALEALEDRTSLMKWQMARDVVKEALAQPEQEPRIPLFEVMSNALELYEFDQSVENHGALMQAVHNYVAEKEKPDDGYCQACDGEMCTAKKGCVALDNPQPKEPEQERCVGCEACIDTACGRDECPKGWPKALQPEQEPVACPECKRLEDELERANIKATVWKSAYDVEVGYNEQEPVAVVTGVYGGRFTYAPFKSTVVLPVGAALYLHPPQRKPLTDGSLINEGTKEPSYATAWLSGHAQGLEDGMAMKREQKLLTDDDFADILEDEIEKQGGGGVGFNVDQLMKAVEKAEFHGGEFEIRGGGKHWIVAIRELPEAPL